MSELFIVGVMCFSAFVVGCSVGSMTWKRRASDWERVANAFKEAADRWESVSQRWESIANDALGGRSPQEGT